MPNQQIMVQMLDKGASVLEVGCATGYMTRFMKESLECRVTAVEIDAAMAEQARPYAHRMIVGDITCPQVWQQIRGGYDCVMFADVLEHLARPWEVLGQARDWLAPRGVVLASIPNIAHYRIRLKLLAGIFEYKQYGILDDTHLRFFTARTARALFEGAGYEVEAFVPTSFRRCEKILLKSFPGAFSIQFVLKARPLPGAAEPGDD